MKIGAKMIVRGVGALLTAALLWSCSSSSGGGVNFPIGVAIDSNGRIYVADYGNNRIVRMDNMNGDNRLTFGSMGIGQGQFSGPSGIAVDSSFHIYVADSGNNRIVEIDNMSGAGWTELGTLGNGSKQFHLPEGIAVGSGGKIYVADAVNNRIVQVDNIDGTNWSTIGADPGDNSDTLSEPAGVAVDGSGKIYVADFSNNRIIQMDSISGTGWLPLGGPASGSGVKQFNSPAGIAVKSDGSNIFVADTGNNRTVQMSSIDGTGWTTLGGPSAGSGMNQFDSPYGIGVGTYNTVFYILVGDSLNDRIVEITDINGTGWITYP
jgi:DNA-binding beta-propeller fold protein YncE